MSSRTAQSDVWDTREYPLRLCQRTDRDTTLTTKRKVLQIISTQMTKKEIGMTEKEKIKYIIDKLEEISVSWEEWKDQKAYFISLLNLRTMRDYPYTTKNQRSR